MFATLKQDFLIWTGEVSQILREQVIDLDPHEYCIGAVFVISIGYVLLSGRN